MKTLRLLLVAIASFGLFASCGDDESPGPGQPGVTPPVPIGTPAPDQELEQRWQALKAEINQMTSNKSCSSDDDCATIAIGFKACGGPDDYVIYSTPNTNEDLLRERVSEFNELDEERDAGGPSDCMMILEPVPACQANQCVGTRPDIGIE